jgi:uncharacterized protein (TIGR03437 family)
MWSRRSFLVLPILLLASAGMAATVGRVVPVGGHVADIALDEARGVLYIANYTANRIDVMSLSDYSIARSIGVRPYPGSLALSPDGHYLVIAHYGGAELAPSGADLVDVLDLTAQGSEPHQYLLPSSPLALAFGADGKALILTVNAFLLFDPASGLYTNLGLPQAEGSPVPVPLATFPPEIMMAELTATPDSKQIVGIAAAAGGNGFFRFRYSGGVITGAEVLTSSPAFGPRVVSVGSDGSYYMTGWGLFGCSIDLQGHCPPGDPLISQWPGSRGELNVGSAAVRSSRGLIYAQIPPQASQGALPPNMFVYRAGNLTVVDRVQIPENLAGRSVFSSDESVLYSISDSGVTVFPMSKFDAAPRVIASVEDVSFRGNLCNSGPASQQIEVRDPAGNATAFQICAAGASCSVPGITVSPSSGVTPATVTITVDPTVLGSALGTKAYRFEIRSATAVNMPPPPARGVSETYTANVRSRFRVLANNRAPEYRGTIFNAPGQLVDVLADPVRARFYVLRQDKNQVLVYNSAAPSSSPIALTTFNTPTQMAMTRDGKYLLVGHNDSQLAYRYDLDTLLPAQPILFRMGHYPKSIAVSNAEIQSAVRSGDGKHQIDVVDMASLTAAPRPSLGVYENVIPSATTLTASPNGRMILGAMPDGSLFAYDSVVGSFVLSRNDFSALKGALAVSDYGVFMADHYLFNESLVQIAPVVNAEDTSSGFAFVGQDGAFVGVRPNGEGYINRMIRATAGDVGGTPGAQPLAVGIAEAPLLGDQTYAFTRTVAPLSDQSALIALTTSGFTVVPWNFDASQTQPVIKAIVNGADFTPPIASGGLISIFGSGLGPMALADLTMPLSLGDSCLMVNGVAIPVLYISPTQVNAQLPLHMEGAAAVFVLHTAGGVSDGFSKTILSVAPAAFLSGTAGPMLNIPLVFREANHELVTVSNPVHLNDRLTIYLTGMGITSPEVPSGAMPPADPPASVVVQPSVTLGGVGLPVALACLVPGVAGVNQVSVVVPFRGVPTGFEVPLTVTQGGSSTTLTVRVVD